MQSQKVKYLSVITTQHCCKELQRCCEELQHFCKELLIILIINLSLVINTKTNRTLTLYPFQQWNAPIENLCLCIFCNFLLLINDSLNYSGIAQFSRSFYYSNYVYFTEIEYLELCIFEKENYVITNIWETEII